MEVPACSTSTPLSRSTIYCATGRILFDRGTREYGLWTMIGSMRVKFQGSRNLLKYALFCDGVVRLIV